VANNRGARADYAAAVDAYDATLTQALQKTFARRLGQRPSQPKSNSRNRRASLAGPRAGLRRGAERYQGGLFALLSRC